MKTFGSIFYYFLKVHLFFAYRLYYRKFQLGGLKNVPKKSPLIFAPNHQNALVDALLAGGPTIRSPYFLARGDVFKKKRIAAFLHGLKMQPIYRFRDGLAKVKQNSSSMGNSVENLMQGNSLLMFPEGNHNLQYRLRPMQKGLARIAFEVEEKSGFTADLKVVPVGIQYEEHFRGGQRTLVNFGKPILVKDYQSDFEKNPREAYDKLLNELSESMESLMVHIPEENYNEIYEKWQVARVYRRDLMEQLAVDKEIIAQLVKGENVAPSLSSQPKSIRFYDILKVLLFTFNLLPSLLINSIVKKKVKDTHFIGTFHFTLSMYLFPIFYFIYAIAVYLLFF